MPSPWGGVLLERKAEVIVLRRKIVDVTLHTAPIEEGDYRLTPVIKNVWLLHQESRLIGQHDPECRRAPDLAARTD